MGFQIYHDHFPIKWRTRIGTRRVLSPVRHLAPDEEKAVPLWLQLSIFSSAGSFEQPLAPVIPLHGRRSVDTETSHRVFRAETNKQ